MTAPVVNTVFVPGTTITHEWLNGVNDYVNDQTGSQIPYTPPFTGGVTTTIQDKLSEYVSVKDFGAVGDFDPTTGIGTDDRAAIQAAFDYAITVEGGCTVVFPSGRYYTGTGYGSYSAYGVILSLGTMSAGSAQNIRIIGEGAEIYQGAAGRCLAVFGAFNVSVENLKMYGYTGGTLGVSRGNDALITLNYNSQYVTISNCYLTNGLGDCIYIGGSLDNGALTGYETRNVIVCNNTLKERYGNGIRSDAGGTKSRTAMAVIDCIGLDVYENKIYGNVDLEPNGNGQYIASVAIKNNRFLSGTVTAQSTIGTAYWYDEPVVTTGGSTILQSVVMTGVAASPVVTDCVVENNTFQDGLIVDGNPYRFDSVAYNFFVKGQIRTGYTSGSNNTAFRRIVGNTALNPYSGEVTFIRLDGNVTQSVFANNVAQQSFTTCINNNGASTGDNGRCTFVNNENIGGTSVIGLTLAATSTEFGSISSGSSNNFAKSNLVQFVASYSPMVSTTSYATGSYTISWSTYRSNTLYISQDAAATVSITDITGELGDGHEITLISGASAGGTTTIVYDASLIRPKGNVDAVMSANNIITFVNRAGIWFEKSRSF